MQAGRIPTASVPLTRAWVQPNVNRILTNDIYAIMPESLFGELSTYRGNRTPSPHVGRLWLCRDIKMGWKLNWFSKNPKNNNFIINTRILLATPDKAM